MQGVDVDEVDVVVALIDQTMNDAVTGFADRAHSILAGPVWRGPDAERIRDEIDAMIRTPTSQLHASLAELRTLLDTTARTQRSASASGPGWVIDAEGPGRWNWG